MKNSNSQYELNIELFVTRTPYISPIKRIFEKEEETHWNQKENSNPNFGY